MKLNFKDNNINIYSDSSYDNISSYSLNRRCGAYKMDEPQTIEWLSMFNDNCVFYDIGSNIGGYSFIANMINKNIKIFSFEPNFMNFYTQVKTCKENNISNIIPINIAINDDNKFNYFKYNIAGNGGDGTFGDILRNQMAKSDYHNPFSNGTSSSLEVGILGVNLDTLVYGFGLDIPDYIKIDVDGNELLVLQGAKKLLTENKVKEIFVEIDDKIYTNNEIENFMKKYPYKINKNINVGTKQKPMRMVLYVRD